MAITLLAQNNNCYLGTNGNIFKISNAFRNLRAQVFDTRIDYASNVHALNLQEVYELDSLYNVYGNEEKHSYIKRIFPSVLYGLEERTGNTLNYNDRVRLDALSSFDGFGYNPYIVIHKGYTYLHIDTLKRTEADGEKLKLYIPVLSSLPDGTSLNIQLLKRLFKPTNKIDGEKTKNLICYTKPDDNKSPIVWQDLQSLEIFGILPLLARKTKIEPDY